MSRVEVTNNDFLFSHGRAPRGRGTWAFELRARGQRVVNPDAEAFLAGTDLAFTFWAPRDLLFSEARAWAVARARELGADLVRTQS